jgi:hypothetical protein
VDREGGQAPACPDLDLDPDPSSSSSNKLKKGAAQTETMTRTEEVIAAVVDAKAEREAGRIRDPRRWQQVVADDMRYQHADDIDQWLSIGHSVRAIVDAIVYGGQPAELDGGPPRECEHRHRSAVDGTCAGCGDTPRSTDATP